MTKILLVVLAILFIFSQTAISQEKPARIKVMEKKLQRMKLDHPGQFHKKLTSFVGKWKVNFESMPGNEQSSWGSGKADCKMIMGDRFLEINTVNSVMGFTVKSRYIISYDSYLKELKLFRFENNSTGVFETLGEYLEDENKYIFAGKYRSLELEKEIGFRYVFTVINESKFFMSMFMDTGEGEFEAVKYQYIKTD